MNYKIILEIIGYIGSAFVLISFLMATVIKLRIVNSIGSIISVVYGLLIHAYPTVVMNAASCQPDFVRLIYCENKIVGLFVAQKESDNSLNILLDYTTKEFRDYSVGHYLFNALTAEKISTLHFAQKAINHEQYLKKTDFKYVDGRFELKM